MTDDEGLPNGAALAAYEAVRDQAAETAVEARAAYEAADAQAWAAYEAVRVQAWAAYRRALVGPLVRARRAEGAAQCRRAAS